MRNAKTLLLLLASQILLPPAAWRCAYADTDEVKTGETQIDGLKAQIDELRASKAPQSTYLLADLIRSLNAQDRRYAQAALREKLTEMSQRHLRNCLVGDDQLEVQRTAIDVAKTTKNKKLIPDLIDLLLHKDPTIQNASKDALIVIVGTDIAATTEVHPEVNKIVTETLKDLLGENAVSDPEGNRENKRLTFQKWYQWWSKNKPTETAIAADMERQLAGPSKSHSNTIETDYEKPSTQKSGKQKIVDKLTGKISKMSVNGTLYRSSSDYFVVGVCEMRSRNGVADLQFMVLQGSENVAQFVVDYMTSPASKRTFRQWHIFDRRDDYQDAEKMLTRIRQYYDKREAYRQRMQKLYRAQNTRRC